jgi:hypothetical protein
MYSPVYLNLYTYTPTPVYFYTSTLLYLPIYLYTYILIYLYTYIPIPPGGVKIKGAEVPARVRGAQQVRVRIT